ncbi:hypothetical protein GCM10027403_00930 [Arthrobacter tecti]
MGIGAGIARVLAAEGWDLALSYWHPYDRRVNQASSGAEEIHALAEELERGGSMVVSLPADLEDPAAADRLIEQATDRLGPLTGLVLSHTESVDSSILDTTLESFDRHFAVNVRASWQLIRAFSLQTPDDGGAIVALTSDRAPFRTVRRRARWTVLPSLQPTNSATGKSARTPSTPARWIRAG